MSCHAGEMFQDDAECVLMNRWQFGQLRADSRKVAADMQLPIFRVSQPFVLREGENGFWKLSAILLEHGRDRKDVMFLFREFEGLFVY